MSDFFRTQMGHRFYESTMPSLVRELARLNTNLERLLAVVERETEKPDEGEPTPSVEGAAMSKQRQRASARRRRDETLRHLHAQVDDDGSRAGVQLLDAQRESCLAYIGRQPGWKLVDERYDDGGFTGANIDRPAFTRLMADVEAAQGRRHRRLARSTGSRARCSTS